MSVNENDIGNRFCLQRFVSVIKFIAERGLAVRGNDEDVGSPRNFSKHFSSKISKKEDAMLLVTGFAMVSQTAGHGQIPCCFKKFCYG